MAARTILIVDDDPAILTSIRDVLSEEGYDVVTAENGKAALDLLATLPEEPCLVFLDMMMPIMDGAAVLAALEAQGRLGTLPVAVISAHRNPKARGARVFVQKPFELDQLLGIADMFCGGC